MSMVPYMTTHSEVSFDHDTIYGNNGINRLVNEPGRQNHLLHGTSSGQ